MELSCADSDVHFTRADRRADQNDEIEVTAEIGFSICAKPNSNRKVSHQTLFALQFLANLRLNVEPLGGKLTAPDYERRKKGANVKHSSNRTLYGVGVSVAELGFNKTVLQVPLCLWKELQLS